MKMSDFSNRKFSDVEDVKVLQVNTTNKGWTGVSIEFPCCDKHEPRREYVQAGNAEEVVPSYGDCGDFLCFMSWNGYPVVKQIEK